MSTSNPTLHEVTSEYLNGFIMTRMSFTTTKTIYCSLKQDHPDEPWVPYNAMTLVKTAQQCNKGLLVNRVMDNRESK